MTTSKRLSNLLTSRADRKAWELAELVEDTMGDPDQYEQEVKTKVAQLAFAAFKLGFADCLEGTRDLVQQGDLTVNDSANETK